MPLLPAVATATLTSEHSYYMVLHGHVLERGTGGHNPRLLVDSFHGPDRFPPHLPFRSHQTANRLSTTSRSFGNPPSPLQEQHKNSTI